jgi:hypothetical protein
VVESVAHLVSSEVLTINMPVGSFTPVRKAAPISTVRVKTVIYITAELAMAVKPGARANEDAAAVKPFRAIVAAWSTVKGSVSKYPYGHNRSHPDTDANLCVCCWSDRQQTYSHHSGQ